MKIDTVFWIITIIFILGMFSGCYTGAAFVIKHTQDAYIPCQITNVSDTRCHSQTHRQRTYIFMTQFVEINNNLTATIDCGKVGNCDPSSCMFQYAIGQNYTCYPGENGYYRLPSYPTGFYFIIALLCIAPIVMLIVFLVFLYYLRKTNKESNTEK